MDTSAKISIAGHRGLVGSAILRNLQARGFTNFVLRTHADGMVRKLLEFSRLHALGWRHKHSMHEGLLRAYEDFLRRLDDRRPQAATAPPQTARIMKGVVLRRFLGTDIKEVRVFSRYREKQTRYANSVVDLQGQILHRRCS